MKWKPIAEAPKEIPKGMIRVYSYAPSNSARPARKGYELPRHTTFDSMFGFRVCDLYMDIPDPAVFAAAPTAETDKGE